VPARIEDYAIIGDTRTVALVDRHGSIDWWCAPRIDSGAAFAALLGTKDNGRWLIAPKEAVLSVSRSYEKETLVLETVFETASGRVAVIDFMPPNYTDPTVHRIVEGRDGTAEMEMELIVRFEYGAITPWVTATGDGLVMVAGSDGLRFHSPVPLTGKDQATVASFEIDPNTRRSFCSPGSPRRDRPLLHWTAWRPELTPGVGGATGSVVAPTRANGATT
jgi:hypothetical protein